MFKIHLKHLKASRWEEETATQKALVNWGAAHSRIIAATMEPTRQSNWMLLTWLRAMLKYAQTNDKDEETAQHTGQAKQSRLDFKETSLDLTTLNVVKW